MMVTFHSEPLSGFLEESKELTRLHWDEIALFRDKIPLDPDYERYVQIEKNGHFRCVTMRDDGKLVGYHVSVVDTHLHYKSTLMAVTDLLFVHRDYRGANGLQFLRFHEAAMKALGVKKLISGTKLHSNFSPVFEYLGWTPTDVMHAKWIGD